MTNWIWMHPRADEGTEAWKRQFGQYRRAGIEGVLALVHNGAQALYGNHRHSVAAPVLEDLLPLALAEGLALHAWLVALRCNAPAVQEAHPEWFSVSRQGKSSLDAPPYILSYQWLCPSRPEVVAYVEQNVAELAAYTELKGIHLDYIRHPDVILPEALQPKYDLVQDREYAQFDFCYCPVCREAFRGREGVDPLELDDASAHAAWRAYRYDSVRHVVDTAARVARASSKALSAAVFATPELARTYVRQDWPSWDLDAAFPMIYHQYYAKPAMWIETATREGVAEIGGRFPLYSGLFIGAIEPEDLPHAVERAAGAGAAGVCLFSHGAMTDAHWRALAQIKT